MTSVEPTKPLGPVESEARRTRPADATPGGAAQAERTYVLDTSVLLSDPRALFRFAEHPVVLPVVVITELESKRNDPEIGFFARKVRSVSSQSRRRMASGMSSIGSTDAPPNCGRSPRVA